ncbi:MAG: N-acetyltransferase family protein [Devosiaceae bacterium]
MKIRPTKSDDVSALQLVLKGTDLFPPEMLPDMLSGFLSVDDSEDQWLTCEQDRKAIGFCYAVPEQLAEGTWNMLAIAVHPEQQRSGAGKAIVAQLESDLRSQGQRILIADTSGTDGFANTREFYRKSGYTEEARIRDFWAKGDDKVVFWKAL